MARKINHEQFDCGLTEINFDGDNFYDFVTENAADIVIDLFPHLVNILNGKEKEENQEEMLEEAKSWIAWYAEKERLLEKDAKEYGTPNPNDEYNPEDNL